MVKVFSFTMRKDIPYNELYRLRPLKKNSVVFQL